MRAFPLSPYLLSRSTNHRDILLTKSCSQLKKSNGPIDLRRQRAMRNNLIILHNSFTLVSTGPPQLNVTEAKIDAKSKP